MKYPIGPKTQEMAAKTVPGQLAILLNRVLYSADVKTIHEPVSASERAYPVKRWVAEDVVYKNADTIPEGMAGIADRPAYFETNALMRAIRDFLEFRSFEEVVP